MNNRRKNLKKDKVKHYIHGESYSWGIMIRSNKKMAITIKNKDGSLTEKIIDYSSTIDKYPLLKIPIIRGIARFFEGSIYQFIGEKYAKEETNNKNIKKNNLKPIMTVLLLFILSVIIYFITPMMMMFFLKNYIKSNIVLNIFETMIRISIFFLLGFVFIRHTDERNQRERFHGAEHNVINCFLKENNISFDNVKKHSIYNPACGTSILFFFFIIPFPFLILFPYHYPILRLIITMLLIPIFIGISFDLTVWLLDSETKIAKILSKPGIFLQKYYAKEPDDNEIEVAIISLKNTGL